MRYYFHDTERVKKAAKRLAKELPFLHLHQAHEGIARTLGYRDWHEFQKLCNSSVPTTLDQELLQSDFHNRTMQLCRSLADTLRIDDGVIQFILPTIRLTGDRSFSTKDHESIRTLCWRNQIMPWLGNREPGAVCEIEADVSLPGRAYLLNYGKPTTLLTDISLNAGRADFEVNIPATRIDDFVPLRLRLPYGHWLLEDQSQILFSRDYMPLWKISLDGKIGRIPCWLWINDIKKQEWFGEEGDWYSTRVQKFVESKLRKSKITSLPMLADALPILVANPKFSIRDAVNSMRDSGRFI